MSNDVKYAIEALTATRVLFAHQSVGRDILGGISRLARQARLADLRIVQLEEAPSVKQNGVYHLLVGANGDPLGKVDHFVALIDSLGDSRPDIALMKFCYVDFTAATDVDSVVSYYGEAIAGLKVRHPDITFAHVTVPLTQREGGVKRLIKRLMCRENNDLTNVRRQQFNQRLVQLFGSDPVFDLARVESTRPDGSRVSFSYEGDRYFALNPDYTDDGAHLNELGQAVTAADLARVIAQAASRTNQGR